MPRNGSGTYSRVAGTPYVYNTTIDQDVVNDEMNDIATALTASLAKDGQTTPSANLPMGGYKHTGVGTASATTHYARADQVQDSAFHVLSSVAGVDTITASAAITPAAYATGQTFRFVSAGANTGAATLNVSSLGAKSIKKHGTTELDAGDIPSGAAVEVFYDGTDFQLINVNKAGTSAYNLIALDSAAKLPAVDASQLTNIPTGGIQDFRLTLTSGTPVTTSDVTGATTIYASPCGGNRIALYNGSAWVVRTSAEFSLALGTLTSGKPYDVFCYDSSGTPTLEFLVWTNDTTRATALTTQDGVLVKSGATTHRYMGTFYTTATTTTEDSDAKRYLWNYYHRRARKMKATDATASWNYTTATYRQANNSTANQLNFVLGVSEDAVRATARGSLTNTNGGVLSVTSIGLDSTSAEATDTIRSAFSTMPAVSYYISPSASFDGYVAAGRHYLAWLEYSEATGTATWYGTNKQGISGVVFG